MITAMNTFRKCAAVFLLAFSGCFLQAAPAPTEISSASWKSQIGAQVDLQSLKIGTPQNLSFALDDGFECACAVRSSGTTLNATLSLSSCSYSGNSMNDPGCADYSAYYTLSVAASGSLEICDPSGSCQSFN